MSHCEVRLTDGTPRLYVGDKKVPPILFGLSDFPGAAANTAYAHKNIAQFAKQGIHLVTADSELRLGWHKVSPFEWEPIQEELASVIEADRQTGILLRLHVNAPYWWMRDNPDENTVYDGTAGIDDGDNQRLIRDDGEKRMRVSLASEKWLQEAGECLRLFCENVSRTEEGTHIIGIQVACGLYGEWAHWGGGNDTSLPMQRRFCRLLREKYGTEEALWKAWGRNDVTFDNAPFLPGGKKGDDGIFRHPILSRDTMDAQLCLQTVLVEDILYFNRIIKKYWNGKVLTGAFYSYIQSNHLLPELLYQNKELIDFLCGPFPYLENRKPQGIPMQRGILESNRLQGLLWLTEMDGHPAGTEHYIGGDPNRTDETVSMLRRNVLQPVVGGQGLWYYDHRLIASFIPSDSRNPYAGSIYRKSGWWDNPILLNEIRKLFTLTKKYALGHYRPAADVLLVYTPKAHFAVSHRVDGEYLTQEAIARCGVSYDCIFLSELKIAEMDRYRCVIFANAYVLTEEEKRLITEKTRGKHTVWLYAAGYVGKSDMSVSHIEEVTGISVCKTEGQDAYIASDGKEILLNKELITPMFAVNDKNAVPIAYYRDGHTAAARKGNTWYFAVPYLQQPDICKVFIEAGVHRYCDSGDPVMAGEGLVAVHAPNGLHTTISFRNGRQISIDLPENTTAVFDAQTAKRLL